MSHIFVDIPGLIILSIGVIIYFFFSSSPYYDEHLIDGYSLTAFGSKTAYKNNGLKSVLPSLLNRRRFVHVNALIRHGTRSPDSKFSKKVEKIRARLQKALPDVDFSVKACGKGDKVLLSPGVKEIEDLGRRLRAIVPNEFRHASNMLVISSETERTIDSAKAFLSTYTDDNVAITEDFRRIRFFADCNNYIAAVRSSEIARKEFYKFRDGKEMQRVLQEVVSDHGLEDLQLTTTDIANLYKVAAYEVAAMEEGSPLPGWVQLFRPEHLYVLEYLHDLKQYWTKGNAFPLSYEQVCPLWGAIMEDMVKAATHDRDVVIAKRDGYDVSKLEKKSSHRSVFWFGHAETLLPLVTKLNLFNESVSSEFGGGEHLTAAGFQSRLRRLQLEELPVPNLFRSSHIIPFAGNIAFFLFYCPNLNEEPSLNDYCLEVRLNEQVVEIIPQADGLPRPLRLPQVLEHFESCLPSAYNKTTLCDRPLSSPPSA
ncbi:multiple inositol polyphosphate phosphatase [Echinococcus multilocularis]|uniref:Multiple inositol polyphosphate phosphatase 1 n=1 Tax=Echinococcus multilocularis TaxID=6211 RepID=A0A068YIG6_ECHMU|nr:multiple inositol polyphosphate phosphatase [Echinococcus multilocularis]